MPFTSIVFLLAPLAQVLAEQACLGGSSVCPSRDSVLLQRTSQHSSLLTKTKSQTLTCETCVDAFDQLGGCDLLMGKDDQVALSNLHARPELAGCEELLGCQVRMHDNCGMPAVRDAALEHSVVTCQTCVDSFAQLRGCDLLGKDDQAAMHNLLAEPLFAGCEEQRCVPQMHGNCGFPAVGDAELEHSVVTCQTCVDSFARLRGCDLVGKDDQVAMQNLLAQPVFAGCEEQRCGPQMYDKCRMPVPRPTDEVEEVCDPSCPDLYERAGGCTALNNGTFAEGMAVLEEPLLEHCRMDFCRETLFERCRPEALPQGFCEDCIAKFEADGGCEAVRVAAAPDAQADDGAINALIPDGCWPCGAEAMDFCMPEVAVKPAPGCHTARKTDPCFAHVRWAMERGAVLHPEWYTGLTRTASFEQFQGLFHRRGEHNCPRPCEELPAGLCHTAAPGEECYRHVRWAREVGIRMSPGMYPSEIAADAPLAVFQAWLHHIHHGDCQAPCGP